MNPAPMPCRILWLDREKEIYVLLDEIDFEWARKWKWRALPDRTGKKLYATRDTRVNGKMTKIFLHKEIVRRARGAPPSPDHVIGDHRNGDSLDCRRDNLRWATRKENARNLFGAEARQLQMFGGQA